MMKFKYMRKENVLYILQDGVLSVFKECDSISKAKHEAFNLMAAEPNSVRRYESLVREFGEEEVKALFPGKAKKSIPLGPRDESLGKEISDAQKN